MEIVILVGLIAVIFATLDSVKVFDKGLLLSFIVIFVFLAIRVDFGNDYPMYEAYYNSLDKSYVAFNDLNSYDDHFEIGWRYLNKIFSVIGFSFNGFLAAIALLNCIIFYKFIKRFVPRNYYWLAIFIYIFNPDFLLIHLSAIRQLVPILLIIISIPLLLNRRYILFIVIILFSALFHTSALFALLLIPIRIINWKYSKRNTFLLGVIYLLLFIVSSSISEFMNSVVSIFFDRYSVYSDEKAAVSTGLGFFIVFIFIVFLLTSKKTMNLQEQQLTNISVFSLLLSVIGINLAMVYRLNMFFIPISIVAFPLMVIHTKDFFQKRFLVVIIIFYYLYNYFSFFSSETYGEFYDQYHTIFK